MSGKRSWAIDLVLIFALTALLILPIFSLEYLNRWSSIESTFIADSLLFLDGVSLNGWNPYWYCGTRADYIYPPGLRLGVAALAKSFQVSTAQAYHWLVGFFYCLGIAFVYWLVRIGSGIRTLGWFAAAGAALLSPSYVLLKAFRDDAFLSHWAPMRLHVLMVYGEGPHMSSLAVLGGFLAASWLGLRRGYTGFWVLSGILAAAVVSLNFYGASAMAMLFPILVWTLWITERDARVLVRAAGVAIVAWGLCAFWLTPSYLRITLDNMRLVSQPGNTWSVALLGVAALVFVALSFRLCYARSDRAWPLFLFGSTGLFCLNVLGNQWFGFRVMGEPHRLVPELDLLLIITAVYLAWKLAASAPEIAEYWRGLPAQAPVAVAGAIGGLMFAGSVFYLAHPWALFPEDKEYRSRIEYQVSDWIANNMPDARVSVDGSMRIWYNVWHTLYQMSGGSDQGLLNGKLLPTWWNVRLGEDPQVSVLWLQAAGTDAVVVSHGRSQDAYKDSAFPQKFTGVLEVLYDSQNDDRLFRVPRRFPDRARVVERAALDQAPVFDGYNHEATLKPYVRAIEEGPDVQAKVQRLSTSQMRIQTRIGEGQALLVQESFDPAWRATVNGESVTITEDPIMGFMLLNVPAGEHVVDLVFALPTENLIGRWVTGLTIVLLTAGCLIIWRRSASPQPAV